MIALLVLAVVSGAAVWAWRRDKARQCPQCEAGLPCVVDDEQTDRMVW